MSATPELTVVICTHNRARYLPACVQSLLDQSLPRDRYEILIVDNASTDETPALCRAWADRGDLRVVLEPVPGLSQARNTGFRAARGRFVGYLDDDGMATHGWCAAALEAFTSVTPQPGWVGGPIDLDWQVAPPDWLDAELQECLGRLDAGPVARWLEARERLGGGNSAYPRELLERIGGFDTRLGRKQNLLLSGEETQLQRRLEAAGRRLYYTPGMRMLHAVPPERVQPAFFQRRYFWGGITDELIRRSLAERGHAPSAPLPSAAASGRVGRWATLGRLLRHTRATLGLASRGNRIRGRIYWAYVLGRVCGIWRWHRDADARANAREFISR